MLQRVSGLSGGTAPALIAGIALAVSGASTYWDIASHVDGGRERFLTPRHIGIYSGVTVALVVIAMAMLSDRLGEGASFFEALRIPFAACARILSLRREREGAFYDTCFDTIDNALGATGTRLRKS